MPTRRMTYENLTRLHLFSSLYTRCGSIRGLEGERDRESGRAIGWEKILKIHVISVYATLKVT